MFRDALPQTAAAISAIIAVVTAVVGIIVRNIHTKYCKKHITEDDAVIIKRANALKCFVLILFSITGLFFGNLIAVGTTFYTAVTHGMTTNPDTGKYDITYGRMLMLNKNSIKETNIDINDLKGKAIIYVRYDCPDCIFLHKQLAEIDDVIFLSSRSENGKAARKLYNIVLTEVPQGVYIDENGKSIVINIMQGQGDYLTLDLQQIAVLREMPSRSS